MRSFLKKHDKNQQLSYFDALKQDNDFGLAHFS